jgi:hypothetical protein
MLLKQRMIYPCATAHCHRIPCFSLCQSLFWGNLSVQACPSLRTAVRAGMENAQRRIDGMWPSVCLVYRMAVGVHVFY